MITHLYKKGNASEVKKNYRSINLINVMSKIFSNIPQSRLKHWCEINNLIPEEQAGFRSNYSTVDIIIYSGLVRWYKNILLSQGGVLNLWILKSHLTT